jgi:hypothetical protein
VDNVKPAYEDWYKTVPAEKNSTESYDLRAAYDHFPYEEMQAYATDPKKHLSDRFKMPNHITFSDQSVYHTPETPGGVWSQDENKAWHYTPSAFVVQKQGADKLKQYFAEREPNSILHLPEESRHPVVPVDNIPVQEAIVRPQMKAFLPPTAE